MAAIAADLSPSWLQGLLLVTIFLLIRHIVTADPQTLPCQLSNGSPCPPAVCPNDTASFECASQSTPDNRTYWTLTVDYTGGYCKDFVYVGQTVPSGSSTCANSSWSLDCESLLGLPVVYFNVTDVHPDSNGTCFKSMLSVNLSSDYTITSVKVICANTSVPFGGIPYLSYGEASIDVIVRPNPPLNVSVEATRGPQTNLTVSWAAPLLGYAPTSYSISVDGVGVTPVSVMATAAQYYSYTFSGLQNGGLYSVSVVSINCGGRSGPARFIPPNSTSGGLIVGISTSVTAVSLLLMVMSIIGANKAYKARLRTHGNNTPIKYTAKYYDSISHRTEF